MYTALARFGYGIAKALRPSKVKKILSPAYEKAVKPAFKGTKYASGEAKLISGIEGAAKKGYEGYRKLYGGTLGTSAGRKATMSGLGGFALGSFLAGDDEDEY
jgi:hypothetical protein